MMLPQRDRGWRRERGLWVPPALGRRIAGRGGRESRVSSASKIVPPDVQGGGALSVDWFADWRTATGTTTSAIRDGTKFSGESSAGALLEVVARTSGFPSWMTNILQVSFNNEDARMLLNGDAANAWPIATTGQYIYYRCFLKNTMSDTGVQSAGSNHWWQTNSQEGASILWEWKVGRESGDAANTYRVLLLLAGASTVNWNLVGEQSVLSKNAVYVFENRIEVVSASTVRSSPRIYNANGELLYTAADFDDGVGNKLSTVNPTFPYTNAGIQLGTNEVGNNGPAGWTVTVGGLEFGSHAVLVSSSADAWIAAAEVSL